jgi:acyl carrier protein
MTDHTELIRDVLAQHGHLSGAASLADEQNLYDAGMTSHASVNVMLALEEHFDLEFPETMLKRSTFESISNLRNALDALLETDNSGQQG